MHVAEMGFQLPVHCGSQGVNMPSCTPVIPQQSPLSCPFVALETRHGAASKWSSLGRQQSTTITFSTSSSWQDDDSGSETLGRWKQDLGGWKSNNNIPHCFLQDQGTKNQLVNHFMIWGCKCIDWFPQTNQKGQDYYNHGVPANPVQIIES